MSKPTAVVMAEFIKDLQRAPERIAPERRQELSEKVYGGKAWNVRTCEGEAMFYAMPGEEREIAVSTAGLASLWCLAYVAMHAMDIAGRAQRRERSGSQLDISDEYHRLQLDEHIEYARSLFHSDKTWPDGLPLPNSEASAGSMDGMVNNAFFGASAWLLLHEVAHLHLGHQKLSPADIRIRDEAMADKFATSWMLECAGNGLYLEFRMLMTSIALSWVMLDATVKSKGSDHPAAINRFNEVTALYRATTVRSAALENSAYLFKLLFDPHSQSPRPVYETPADFFDFVAARMNEIFPR